MTDERDRVSGAGKLMLRALVFGVPRSGKSRLASRLVTEYQVSHLPVDSLVSALGVAFPRFGVGRQYSDSKSASAIAPLLREWVPHLDYERLGYVVEGYHINVETAAELTGLGVRTVALGYSTVDELEKCQEIRMFERPQDWTASLSDSELLDFVRRYREESAVLHRACSERSLEYFDVGIDSGPALERAFESLSVRA
jgi:hypothetical protein